MMQAWIEEARRGVPSKGVLVLAGLIAVAAAARAWLLWSTPLMPGMNGGYYLVQARALLEHAALGIPDLPLTFLLQAGCAKLVQLLSGRGLEASILFAVRLCEALLPPLVAVPVYLLGRRWCAQADRGEGPALAAAALASFGAPALSMVGDFEKNALGLVWLAGLTAALHAWMSARTRPRAAAVLLLLGLCGLTHIGVFGAALLLTALTGAADLALMRGGARGRALRHTAAVAAGGLAVVALVAGLVLWKYDPSRIRRLAGALTHPVTFLETGGRIGERADARAFAAPRAPLGGSRLLADRPGPDAPPRRREPDGPGRPPLGRVPQGVSGVLFLLVAAGALVLPAGCRGGLLPADRATTIGCAATLVLLTGPWIQGDMAPRLRLIAMVPAAFAVAYGLAHLPGRKTAPACAVALLALVAATSLPLVVRGGRPIIGVTSYGELCSLSRYVKPSGSTLVVARHGLEWWTAWALHTHVAQARAVSAADWSAYDKVLYLQEKRTGADAEPGRPRGVWPPRGFRGPPPGAPPLSDAAIPADAVILHEGAHYRLAQVIEPPAAEATPGPEVAF